MRTNTKKPSYITEQHKLMDEKFSVVRTKQNGDIYQFMMWIDDEKKMIRRTLSIHSLPIQLLSYEHQWKDWNSNTGVGER